MKGSEDVISGAFEWCFSAKGLHVDSVWDKNFLTWTHPYKLLTKKKDHMWEMMKEILTDDLSINLSDLVKN